MTNYILAPMIAFIIIMAIAVFAFTARNTTQAVTKWTHKEGKLMRHGDSAEDTHADDMTSGHAECKHEKVYANYILTSHPPQYPWICKVCGYKGVDRDELVDSGPTYDDLVRKFEEVP